MNLWCKITDLPQTEADCLDLAQQADDVQADIELYYNTHPSGPYLMTDFLAHIDWVLSGKKKEETDILLGSYFHTASTIGRENAFRRVKKKLEHLEAVLKESFAIVRIRTPQKAILNAPLGGNG